MILIYFFKKNMNFKIFTAIFLINNMIKCKIMINLKLIFLR